MPVRGSSSTEQPRPSPTYLPSESTQEGEAFFFLRKENLATQTDREAGPHKRLPQSKARKRKGTAKPQWAGAPCAAGIRTGSCVRGRCAVGVSMKESRLAPRHISDRRAHLERTRRFPARLELPASRWSVRSCHARRRMPPRTRSRHSRCLTLRRSGRPPPPPRPPACPCVHRRRGSPSRSTTRSIPAAS